MDPVLIKQIQYSLKMLFGFFLFVLTYYLLVKKYIFDKYCGLKITEIIQNDELALAVQTCTVLPISRRTVNIDVQEVGTAWIVAAFPTWTTQLKENGIVYPLNLTTVLRKLSMSLDLHI